MPEKHDVIAGYVAVIGFLGMLATVVIAAIRG